MTDVGRRFLVTRVLELLVELDEQDVQAREPGESCRELAASVASSIPLDDWSTAFDDVEEVS